MPTIRVELFEGRTPEQKAELGGNPGGVDVIFVDVERHNWATGGVLWSQQGST